MPQSWSVGVLFTAVDGEAVQLVKVLRAGQGRAGKPQGEGRKGVKSQGCCSAELAHLGVSRLGGR